MEVIGKVTTSKGEYTVSMPTVGEMISAGVDMSQPGAIYKLAAVSINVPYEEFQTWGMDDASMVIQKLSTALTTFFKLYGAN